MLLHIWYISPTISEANKEMPHNLSSNNKVHKYRVPCFSNEIVEKTHKKTLNVIVVFNSNKRYDNNLHPKQPWGTALTKYQKWQ
jgi:hypothetical protein